MRGALPLALFGTLLSAAPCTGRLEYLEQGDVQTIGVLDAHVAMAPGGVDRGVDQGGAVGQQAFQCSRQIRYLEGEADRAADPAAGLDLIDCGGVWFVEDLQGGSAQLEEERAIVRAGPELGRFDAQAN